MKRPWRIIGLFLATLLLGLQPAAAAPAAPEPRSVVDPTGRTVRVPADPQRVVALAPSVTEIVYALGREARLVGVTRYSNYPPEAQQLPLVGSYIQLDVERIVSLRPDLCIAVKDGNPIAAVEQLESMGLAVFAINPSDLETVMRSVLAVGGLLGAEPRAQTVVGDMRRRIQAVQTRVTQAPRHPRIFFQIGVTPIVSVGSNTFIHTLIELAGGVNVAAGPSPYPRYSREQVIALAPDVIVISAMERAAQFHQVKAEWMQWPAIPAVKNQAVFIAPNDLFERPSPRLVEALEVLAAFLHPELFKERP